jgi:hypothetical protein
VLAWARSLIKSKADESRLVRAPDVGPGETNDMKDVKTLVVGSLRHDHATTVPWAKVMSVNITDFDIVLVFLPSLDSVTISSLTSRTLFKLQHEFSQFLKSDGELVVLGAPPLPDSHTQWLWCPIPIVSLAQKGDTIETSGEAFAGLLGHLKSWDCVYRLNEQSPAQVLNGVLTQGAATIVFEYLPYAWNRAKGILAARFTYYTPTRGNERHDWPGSVTVLPHFPDADPHTVVSVALEDMLGKPQSEGEPAWLSSIPMSPVFPIDARLATLTEEISSLENQVEQQLAHKAQLERFKRLLYVSSFELEDLVAECLSLLGATIKPARYSQEEFVMELGDAVFLAECKGVSKSISLQHFRQLQDYVLKYEEDEQKAGKGILFGNAWRDLPPSERDTKDKPIFPGNVIDRAKQFGVSLVSTVDLFDVFCRFLNKEVSGEAILTCITSASGVADFGDLNVD